MKYVSWLLPKSLGNFYYLPKICQKMQFLVVSSGFHEGICFPRATERTLLSTGEKVAYLILRSRFLAKDCSGELWAGFPARAWQVSPSQSRKGGRMCSGEGEGRSVHTGYTADSTDPAGTLTLEALRRSQWRQILFLIPYSSNLTQLPMEASKQALHSYRKYPETGFPITDYFERVYFFSSLQRHILWSVWLDVRNLSYAFHVPFWFSSITVKQHFTWKASVSLSSDIFETELIYQQEGSILFLTSWHQSLYTVRE